MTVPLGLCGYLSCLQGKLVSPGSQMLSSAVSWPLGRYLTEFFCHLLSWGWSWEPRPSQESQGCWSGLSFTCS